MIIKIFTRTRTRGGCCGFNQNEPCSLTCTGDAGLVAACRLGGVIGDDGPGLKLVAVSCQAALVGGDGTFLTFDEGEEFIGSELSTYGSVDGFPCFRAGL